MSKSLFLKPLDVLYLRGNRLFGEGGDDAGAQMPPWPSVAAGAIRSRMLVDAGADLHAFAKGEAKLPEDLATCLGTPGEPGAFRLARFTLARLVDGAIEPLLPLPADWLAFGEGDARELERLRPAPLPEGVRAGLETLRAPRLRAEKPGKPAGGLWMTAGGIERWLRDEPLDAADIVPSGKLWQADSRLGIAMEPERRTADEGRIYTTDAVALADDAGFLAEVAGADGLLPKDGLLRFGGDGRGASVSPASVNWPEPDWDEIGRTGRFRLLLTSPGIFADGWRPPIDGARLAAAAVNRAEVVSGWDVAAHAPKPAERCAPAGSVYWFDGFGGDIEALKAMARDGLPCKDRMRRAEGFNSCLIGNWKKEGKEA